MNRIVIEPAILTGKPLIRGTRLSVEFLRYAAGVVRAEKVYPLGTA